MRKEITHGQRMWLAFFRNRTAIAGGVIAALIFLTAIFAPWIAPYDPLDQDPIFRLEPGNEEHWLGTDDFGRDVLSRLIWGSRISLVIGFASVLIGMIAGTALGMIAGYYRGRVETMIMRSIDVVMSFPDLILAVAITAALGATLVNLILTIGVVMIPGFARMAHSALHLSQHLRGTPRGRYTLGRGGHSARGEPRLHRSGCAATHRHLGQHDPRGRRCADQRPGHFSLLRPVHPYHDPGIQHAGRRGAGHDRPASEGHLIFFNTLVRESRL
jgi:hypothetical protein